MPTACRRTRRVYWCLRKWGSRTPDWPSWPVAMRPVLRQRGSKPMCGQPINGLIPAPLNSPRKPPICIRPMRATVSIRRKPKLTPPIKTKSLSWAAGRTGSAKALSSIIAAFMPPMPCGIQGMSPSWSIVIRKPSRPITIPRTVFILSRSPQRMSLN